MAQPIPHTAQHFLVDAGFSRIGFSRVHLPRLERDVIRYREGSDPQGSVRLLPGLLRVGECVLERGVVASDNEFFTWLTQAAQRRDVAVKLLDASHQPVRVWLLSRCFPTALEWSVLDAQQGTVLIETLRLAVESMDVQTV